MDNVSFVFPLTAGHAQDGGITGHRRNPLRHPNVVCCLRSLEPSCSHNQTSQRPCIFPDIDAPSFLSSRFRFPLFHGHHAHPSIHRVCLSSPLALDSFHQLFTFLFPCLFDCLSVLCSWMASGTSHLPLSIWTPSVDVHPRIKTQEPTSSLMNVPCNLNFSTLSVNPSSDTNLGLSRLSAPDLTSKSGSKS